MDRLLLVASTFCFLFGFAYTMYALGARVYQASRLNFFSILAGFALQSAFLYLRGQQIGRCPLTSTFEGLIFLSWSMVMFYLLIGPAYRLSLLGAFTSPLALLLQVTALCLPSAAIIRPAANLNGWLELHAAMSVLAYGAFALAGVTGVMYLAQERALKTHRLRPLFFHLPPIHDLAVANGRLVLCGFCLFTIGLAAGWANGSAHVHILRIISVGIWAVYGAIVFARMAHQISPRRVAWLSIWAFAVALSTFWGLQFLGGRTAS